ncbi:MAG TPA: hypothetical protein VGQ26_11325 [Streptosporangiaceae bacterium]|jgi:hypothetical protein|nr:hypothetical protein [Streptosporangiaceae bacterium]
MPENTPSAGGGPARTTRPAEVNRERCRIYRLTLKAVVLAHYGRQCACCGTTDDLTIDHIAGDGGQHRRELFGRTDHGGQHYWLWLIKQGFPPGHQVLCRPCNASKGRTAHCRLDHCTESRAA